MKGSLEECSRELKLRILDFKILITKFESIRVEHTNRELNKGAHALASME